MEQYKVTMILCKMHKPPTYNSMRVELLTTVDAVTKPNIGTPAFAKARLAAVIAAARADPPLSRTVA